MALVTFTNNQAPYLNADNLNNNFQYLEDKIQDIYSTNEIEIGTYIDNKPIYRKTIQQNLNLSSSGVHNFDIGLSNVDKVVDLKYKLIAGSRQLTYNSAINAVGIDSNSSLYIYTGVNWDNNIPFTITVEYTKTTD